MQLLQATVARFLGIEVDGFGRWQEHHDGDLPRVNIRQYQGGTPHVFIIVRPDWVEKVHATGLADLQPVPNILPPVLVLDAGETFHTRHVLLNEAAWTLGGTTIKGGWIARDGPYYGFGRDERRAEKAARKNAVKASEYLLTLKELDDFAIAQSFAGGL